MLLIILNKLHPEEYSGFKSSGSLLDAHLSEVGFYFGFSSVTVRDLASYYYSAMNDASRFFATMSGGNNREKGMLADRIAGRKPALNKIFDLVELSYNLDA